MLSLPHILVKIMSEAGDVKQQSEGGPTGHATRDQSQDSLRLPNELLWAIMSYLTPVDTLMLRWTCTWLYAVTPEHPSALTQVELNEIRDIVRLDHSNGQFTLSRSAACWSCRATHPLNHFWPAQLSAPMRTRSCKLGSGVLHPGMSPLNYTLVRNSFIHNGFKMTAGFRKSLSELPPESRAPPFYCSCTMKPKREHSAGLIRGLRLDHLPRDYVISTMAEFSPWPYITTEHLKDSAFIERHVAKHHTLWICSHLHTCQERVLALARSLEFPITRHEQTSPKRHCMECPTTFRFLLRREQKGLASSVQLVLHVKKTIGDIKKLTELQNTRWMALLHNHTETAETESSMTTPSQLAD